MDFHRSKEGITPHEIAVFVRSPNELPRATAAANQTGIPFKILDNKVESTSGKISISTMHLAKGLEFRAVAVMACDDEISRGKFYSLHRFDAQNVAPDCGIS